MCVFKCFLCYVPLSSTNRIVMEGASLALLDDDDVNKVQAVEHLNELLALPEHLDKVASPSLRSFLLCLLLYAIGRSVTGHVSKTEECYRE